MFGVQCAWFLSGSAQPFAPQMAVESKPLFHPKVLRQNLEAGDGARRRADILAIIRF
jgi:hypothetical protein